MDPLEIDGAAVASPCLHVLFAHPRTGGRRHHSTEHSIAPAPLLDWAELNAPVSPNGANAESPRLLQGDADADRN